MSAIAIEQFDAYFNALHGHAPYPWQRRLAKQVVKGNWPGAIDLPTGSGKTASVDIAIFAMACQASRPAGQRTSPRRVFFCVNRRVIVDEAYTRARHIAEAIWEAERRKADPDAVLHRVAVVLRRIAGTSPEDSVPPLDVLEVRGGIYRDNRWARSVVQPTIVCTTLDQLGSRLLFRGYGVSSNAAPIQAALIAYDSLILLDEAHISEPFRQTLDQVHRYLDPHRWAEQSIGIRPATIVPMTATPNEEMRRRGLIGLEDNDRDPKLPLLNRLTATKPAQLRQATNVAKEAISIAESLGQDTPVAAAIIVNRIATARTIYDQLRLLQSEPSDKKRKVPTDAIIELVIGSMRPIDRDEQCERLRPVVGSDRPTTTCGTSFIVATQCLEVGADYDFDVLITECASLDALRQRFGRLNRAGRAIDAQAFIVADKKAIRSDDTLDPDRPLDPIYGNALSRTWNWLIAHADDDRIDFGIDAFRTLLDSHGEDDGQPPKDLLAPSASLNAPVMLPAYVDLWCQTAPKPVPEPDVSLFIHGPQRGEPDVQVCWRADLIQDDGMGRDQWADTVALLPPTSAECMSVPISRVRRWLGDQMGEAPDHGDLLGVSESDDETKTVQGDRASSLQHPGVLWRGTKDTVLIDSPGDLRPGDTVVLPASACASHVLGHLPPAVHADPWAAGELEEKPQVVSIDDVAETAFTRARDLAALRLHPALRSRLPVGAGFDTLFTSASERDESVKPREWAAMLRAAANAISDEGDELSKILLHMADTGIRIERYPDHRGVVLVSRRRLNTSSTWFIRPMDDGDDESSRVQREAPVLLTDHTQHVLDTVIESLACLSLGSMAGAYKLAARLHDLGKADERFQAMLRHTDRTDVWLLVGVTSELLAKSAALPTTFAERIAARVRAGLPAGFRHEMLSVQLAEQSQQLPGDAVERDLILHLIAAHHGHARPFAPVVRDDERPAVVVGGINLTHEQRGVLPPHRLDSGIAERFWSLTHRFGWWGLPFLEAVLRLADQQASAAEDAREHTLMHVGGPAEATT